MITIINRNLNIPPCDQQIAMSGDNETDTVIITVTEPNAGDYDYKLDVSSRIGSNTIELDKTINSDGTVTLSWAILSSQITCRIMQVQVRATQGTDVVWCSTVATMRVGASIGAGSAFPDPLPSEFVQMEADVMQAKIDAQTAAAEAGISVTASASSAEQAAASADTAASQATASQSSAAAASASAEAASASEQAAAQSASAASASESSASGSASAAQESASSAASNASTATQAEGTATGAAQTATTQAGNASASASEAAASESAAASSASGAASSASAAATSEASAAGYASAAATSATGAASSAASAQLDLSLTTVTAVSNVFTLDLSASRNFAIETTDTISKTINLANVPSDTTKVISVAVLLKYTNAAAITHPSGVVWRNAVIPTFTAGYKYILLYESWDGGTTWMASYMGAW